MNKRYTSPLSLFLFYCALLSGCSVPGQRLLNMEIYHDDQLVLRTTFDAPDSEPPAELWKYASEEPFSMDDTLPEISAESPTALEATIEGSVQIKIVHGDQIMTSASFETVRLVRGDPDSGWSLSADVAKAAKQSGKHSW
ncbi:hypothetical protein N9D23_13150 [Rubripirellula sp.]|nr:hypothetical protein [Rubripirellula sp.]